MPALPYLIIFFILTYLAFLVISILATGQGALNSRFMTVVYIALAILLSCWFYRLSGLLNDSEKLRTILIVVIVGLALMQTGYSVVWTVRRYEKGVVTLDKTREEPAVVGTPRE